VIFKGDPENYLAETPLPFKDQPENNLTVEASKGGDYSSG
jgi:hypothetical protein